MSKLTPRQEAFVHEYLVDLNATQAAIRAGYSAKTAESRGSQLLRNVNVKSAIAKAQERLARRLGVRQERVILEYARIAFADIRDVVQVTEKGVRITPSDEWNEDDAATVSEIRQDKDGNVSLKMHSKTHALDMIGKHLGMFVDRKNITVKSIDQMSEAELEALLAEDDEAEAGTVTAH